MTERRSAVVVVDTNILVDAMAEDSPRHSKARSFLESTPEFLVPTIVIYELVWLLRKLQVSSATVEEIVSRLISNPRIRIVSDDGELSAWALKMINDRGIDLSHFNDKVILATASRSNAAIATYDEELRNEATSAGVSVLIRGL